MYNLIKSNALTDTIDFSVNSSTSGTNGIYTTNLTEDGSDVYYFRGSYSKLNNNLIFNNMCWKIIRTTETGGVKLIYNGTPTNNQCLTQKGSATYIGKSSYTSIYNNSAYEGYMHGTIGSEDATTANTIDSTIKAYVDSWYKDNFTNTAIKNKIEDTIYCNDRSLSDGTTNNTLDASTVGEFGGMIDYGAISRASYYTITPSPTLKCPQDNDKFTVSSSLGNGALTYPVGLITLDELVFAGFNTYESNNSNYSDGTNYLDNADSYWTMTPVTFMAPGRATVGLLDSGTIDGAYATRSRGVRPVISLNTTINVESIGTGTTKNPYIVQ